MAFEVTYVVDDDMQMQSARQLHALTTKGRFTGLFVLAAVLFVLLALVGRSFVTGVVFGGALVVVIIAAAFLILSKRIYYRTARDFMSLDDDHTVHVLLDDSGVEISFSQSHRRIPWPKITRVARTDDFVMLYHGMVLLATLPKARLGPEGLAFINRHLPPPPVS